MTDLSTTLPPQRSPDFSNLLKVLKRQRPDRPTLFEFFLNHPLYARLSGTLLHNGMEPDDSARAIFRAFERAGYDYATFAPSKFGFPAGARPHEKTASLNEGAVITDWNDIERYPWQSPGDYQCEYDRLDTLRPFIPEGMKLIVNGPGGVLENLISLTGYDNLCYLLADDPELVRTVADAIGSRLLDHYRLALQYDSVGAIISNDDWGFKTQTMLSPDDLRSYIIPWHRKIVRAAHDANRPAILHSCGNLASVMDDIIDDIGFDGKHSYEDAIQPVEDAYEQYGRRIAILGGIDLDFIVRSEPDVISRRSRAMIERAADRGSYALGTGNSVPEYVPPAHYFAMIRTALDG